MGEDVLDEAHARQLWDQLDDLIRQRDDAKRVMADLGAKWATLGGDDERRKDVRDFLFDRVDALTQSFIPDKADEAQRHWETLTQAQQSRVNEHRKDAGKEPKLSRASLQGHAASAFAQKAEKLKLPLLEAKVPTAVCGACGKMVCRGDKNCGLPECPVQ